MLEQSASMQDGGLWEQGPVLVEPTQLSLRAELAILGYSLWDLSPEVVARALEDPNLTETQKQMIFRKMNDQTERSIKKALKECP